MASQKYKQYSVLFASTLAFTICFMIWMMFAVIGIPIQQKLGLNATEFGIPVNRRSIGTITLACPDVPEPMSMRYAWRSWGPAPLFNSDGLPAQPFRLNLTDHTASNDDGE